MAYFFHFWQLSLCYIYRLKKNFFFFWSKLNYFLSLCSVRPALVDTDLHVHSASAQGKVSGGRGRGGSYFVH